MELPLPACWALVGLWAGNVCQLQELDAGILGPPRVGMTPNALGRFRLVYPLIKALMLVSDYWAYNGHGTLRAQSPDFCAQILFQRQARETQPATRLRAAGGILRILQTIDEATVRHGIGGGIRQLFTQDLVHELIDHLDEALSSIDHIFWRWTPSFEQRNDRAVRLLRDCCGYSQLRAVVCRVTDQLVAARDHLPTLKAVAAVSRQGRDLALTCHAQARVFIALACILLHRTSLQRETNPWLGFRADVLSGLRLAFPDDQEYSDTEILCSFGSPRHLAKVWANSLVQVWPLVLRPAC